MSDTFDEVQAFDLNPPRMVDLGFIPGPPGPPGTGEGGVGTTDHGALTGRGDDDHLQYHTDARGDARYYRKAEVDSALAGKANVASVPTTEQIQDLVDDMLEPGDNVTLSYNDATGKLTINANPGTPVVDVEREVFTITGELTVGDRPAPLHNTGNNRTITSVAIACGQAPTGTANADALGFVGKALVADVMINGSSIFAAGNRPTLDNATNFSGVRTNMASTSWPAGQALTVGVDAIGSVSPGNTLVVTVSYTESA